MFKLNEKYEVDQRILKCDFIRYSPSEISILNTANSQIYSNIPGGDSVNSLKESLLRLNLDKLHAATNNRYVDGDDKKLVNLGPVALFYIYKLATISGNYMEEINQAHIVCLMYKFISSARETDDLSIGFDRDRRRRQNN